MVPFIAAASICAMLGGLVDDIQAMRQEGLTQQEAKVRVSEMQIPDKVKHYGITSIPVVYMLGQGVSTVVYKGQLELNCEYGVGFLNGEYQAERARGRAGDRSRHELYRGVRSDAARDSDP